MNTDFSTVFAHFRLTTRDQLRKLTSSTACTSNAGSAVALLAPDDPNTLLTRKATAEALNATGYPVRPATLATKASRGGGPPFRRFGPLRR